MSTQLTKVGRVERALAGAKNKLAESARLGSTSMIGGLGGGIAAGWCQAKYPTLLNTTVDTAGVVGATLIAGALVGWFGGYGDEAAALGTGMVAASVSREAEKYFS